MSDAESGGLYDSMMDQLLENTGTQLQASLSDTAQPPDNTSVERPPWSSARRRRPSLGTKFFKTLTPFLPVSEDIKALDLQLHAVILITPDDFSFNLDTQEHELEFRVTSFSKTDLDEASTAALKQRVKDRCDVVRATLSTASMFVPQLRWLHSAREALLYNRFNTRRRLTQGDVGDVWLTTLSQQHFDTTRQLLSQCPPDLAVGIGAVGSGDRQTAVYYAGNTDSVGLAESRWVLRGRPSDPATFSFEVKPDAE